MNYENKEDHFKKRGNLFLEISAIMILVLLVMFAAVVFHFYAEVNRLYDDKQALLTRIEAYGQRSANLQDNRDLNHLRNEQAALRRQLMDIEGKLDAVRANNDMQINAQRTRIENLDRHIKAIANNAKQRKPEVISKSKRRKVIDDLQVDLATCSEKMMYIYCDITLEALGGAGRRVEISNQSTLLEDADGITYPISSFSLGATSENEVRYKAKVFVSKARPVKLRFRFFEPPVGAHSFSVAQFYIDGVKIPFEEIRVEH
ncbi:cell division protein FtsB [Labrenzia sp. EL_195]|nr:cell division protein FtsB [Labrenzia sp. EL_195]